MTSEDQSSTNNNFTKHKITVTQNGPYRVDGNVPLVQKTQVVSEYGEPLTWRKDKSYETCEPYYLCRCGHTHNKPYCDGTHCMINFDGTETADTHPIADRQAIYTRGTNIVVKRDFSICTGSGFCGNQYTNVEAMVPETFDTQTRSNVIAMIERCPSGSYTYAIQEDENDIEPDLPEQIAVTVEITSEGAIDGPLWVTGNIPIERADGLPLETRNRVTLCCCGRSTDKPLCDGSHRL
jgi:CDGSH-type Zn-finger protein